MFKLNSYKVAFLCLFLISVCTQSCTDRDSVSITGNINVNEAKFTIIDNSENSTTFDDVISGGNSTTLTVDGSGDFDVTFRPSGSLTEFSYTYGVLRSMSIEIPIDIELGSEIDLGLLQVEEPVQVRFTIPDFVYVNEAFVDFTTFSANGFEANTDGSSEVNGILRGYLYENQLNSIVVSQLNSDGEEVSVTYEFTAADLTFDEMIELK